MDGMLMLLVIISITVVLAWTLNDKQRKRVVSLLLCAAMMSSYIPAINMAKADVADNLVMIDGQVVANGSRHTEIGSVTYSSVDVEDVTETKYTIDMSSARIKVWDSDVLSFKGMISVPEGEMISWVRVDVYDAETEIPYTVGTEYYRADGLKTSWFDLQDIPAMTIGEDVNHSGYTLEEGKKYILMFSVGVYNGYGFADHDQDILDDQGPAILIDVKMSPENCDHPHDNFEYALHNSGETRVHSYDDPLTHQIEPLYERYCGQCGIFLMNIWGQGKSEEHTMNANGMCVMCGFIGSPEFIEETDGDHESSNAPVFKFGKYMTLEDFGIVREGRSTYSLRRSSNETYLNRQTIRPVSSYYGYQWIANRSGYSYPFKASFELSSDYMPQNSVYIAVANYDCDEAGNSNCCEYDQVYINGNLVGVLTGENDTSNTTLLKVDKSFLKAGTNEIVIYVGNKIKKDGYEGDVAGSIYRDDPYTDWWLRVDDIQVLCDGGSSDGRPDVFRVNINKAEITNNSVKCYVTTQVEDSGNRTFKLEYALYDWSNEESATYGQIIDDDFATIYSGDYNHEGTLTMPVDSLSGTYTAVVYLKDNNGDILAYDEESFEYETGLLPSFDVQNFKAVPANLNWTNQNVEINLSADIDPTANLKNLQFYISNDMQSKARVDSKGHVTGKLSIPNNGFYTVALRYTKDGKTYSKTTTVEINNIDRSAPTIEIVKNTDKSVIITYQDDKSGVSDARYCISYDSNRPNDSIYVPFESGEEIVFDIYPCIHYILKDHAGNVNDSYYLAARLGTLDQPVITVPENGSTVNTLTPIVKWKAVPNATSYRLYMRDVTDSANQSDDSTLMFPKEGVLVGGNVRQLDISKNVVSGKKIQSGRKYNIAVQAINPEYDPATSYVSFYVLHKPECSHENLILDENSRVIRQRSDELRDQYHDIEYWYYCLDCDTLLDDVDSVKETEEHDFDKHGICKACYYSENGPTLSFEVDKHVVDAGEAVEFTFYMDKGNKVKFYADDEYILTVGQGEKNKLSASAPGEYKWKYRFNKAGLRKIQFVPVYEGTYGDYGETAYIEGLMTPAQEIEVKAYLNLYANGWETDPSRRTINASVHNYGGDGTPIEVDSNMNWTVSTDAEWITLTADKKKNQILHHYEPNTDGYERTATITVSAPSCEDWTIFVTQEIIPLEWTGKVGGEYNRYALVDLTRGTLNPYYTYELQVYDEAGTLIKTKEVTAHNQFDYYKDLGMLRGKRYRMTVKENDHTGKLVEEYPSGIVIFDYFCSIDEVRSGKTPVAAGGVIYSGEDISIDWTGSTGYGADIYVTIGNKNLHYPSDRSDGTITIKVSEYEKYLTSDRTNVKIVLDVEGKIAEREHVIIKAGQKEDAMIYSPDNGEMIRVFDGEEIVVKWSPFTGADYYKVQFGWCNPNKEGSTPQLIKSFRFEKNDLLELVITKSDLINLLENSGISELLKMMPDDPEDMLYEFEFLVIAYAE